jgi:hypothetical protein
MDWKKVGGRRRRNKVDDSGMLCIAHNDVVDGLVVVALAIRIIGQTGVLGDHGTDTMDKYPSVH